MIFRSIQLKYLFDKTSDAYDENSKNRKSKESKKEPDQVNRASGIDGNCGKGKGYIKKGNNLEEFHN